MGVDGGDTSNQYGDVEWVLPPAPPGWWGGDAPPPPLRPMPARRRRPDRRTLVVALACVVLAVAGTAAWTLTRPGPVPVTWAGSTVTAAGTALDVAGREVRDLAAHRHGATTAATRCYFDRVGGHARTDVSSVVYCGPVLFYDGTRGQDYLSYALQASTSNGRTTLTVAADPTYPTPAARPADGLERPDRRSPPAVADGLRAPVPPAAAPDVLTALDLTDLGTLPAGDPGSVIGSASTTVHLLSYGTVTHYGHDDAERSVPSGRRLVGFALSFTAGEASSAAPQELHIGVSVDGAAVRPLPMAGINVTGEGYVAAVPTAARSVDLVLTDEGVTQRLSLVDGMPASNNVAVLRRSYRFTQSRATGSAVARINNGGDTFTAHLTVQVYEAALAYFLTRYGTHPSHPQDAFLVVDLCYSSSDFVDSTTCHSFRGTELTLTPDGGRPIRCRNVSHDSRAEMLVFEVPATFTTGTLTVAGAESSGDGWSMNVTTPWSTQIEFNAG